MLNRFHAQILVEDREYIEKKLFLLSDKEEDDYWSPTQVIYGSYLFKLELMDEVDFQRCVKYEDNSYSYLWIPENSLLKYLGVIED
jgi:hypothetical protein